MQFFSRFTQCLCGGKNDTIDRWIEIAKHIKILYDSQFDYHPQFEGYEIGTEIKQADAVLIGYPMMFPMNASTRLNDLNYYVNATRPSGPAMTYSMFAINYLDIDDRGKASEMLDKSYKQYIRKPFNVWSEVVQGEIGATNFITGAGGFLQTIFNGYFGIRLHLDHMEIKSPKLPKYCKKLIGKGFSYLNSKFELKILGSKVFIRFLLLNENLIITKDNQDMVEIVEGILCKFPPAKSIAT